MPKRDESGSSNTKLREEAEILRDIAERKAIEDALRESEARWQFALEGSGDGVWDWDAVTNHVHFSIQWKTMLGYAEHEIGDTLDEWDRRVHPDDKANVYADLERHFRRETAHYQNEHRVLCKDGSYKWILDRGKVIEWTEDGKPRRVIGTHADITDRKRMEETLREGEARAKAMLQAIPDLMFRMDNQGVFLDYKADATDLYAQAEPTIIGRRNRDITPPEFADLIERQICATLESRTLQTFEYQLTIPGRGVRDYEARMVASGADEVTAVVRDITDRKRAEEGLRESEQRLKAVMDAAPIAIAWANEEGKVEYINRKHFELFGYTIEEIPTVTEWRCLAYPEPAYRETIPSIVAAYKEHGGFAPYEATITCKDGSQCHVIVSAATVSTTVIHMLIDITSRKHAEEALQESETYLKSILRAAPVGVGTVVNRVIVQANDSLCAMTGYTQGELQGQNARLLYPTQEDFAFVGREKYRQIIEHGTGTVETRWLRKDGRLIDVLLSSTPLDLDDLQKGVIFTALDITERKQLESQLLQSQKMEAIGTLAGGVAHDFNNILTAIIGFASVLRMDMEEDDSKTAYLDQILASGQRAANLTQSLLAFSRKQKTDLKPHRINDIIEQTSKLLKRLLTEDIELEVTLTPANPAIMADITQIDQILINLATNARDAMPRGGSLRIKTGTVTLGDEFITLQGHGEPGNYVELLVSDTGMGIDEKTKEHIFEPFFTTKEVGKGTGLGLSTVYGVVKQHNGHVRVDSEPNKGTTFHILFPLIRSIKEDRVQEMQDLKRGTETILVAEDDPAVRTLIINMLRRYGYATFGAADGEEALRLFVDNNAGINLIICDVVMPGMNGREVCEAIKKIRPTIKVLFTSGYTNDVIIDKGVEDKTVDFINKPIKPREFLTKVREMLDGKNST